jgi:hypothetical protein
MLALRLPLALDFRGSRTARAHRRLRDHGQLGPLDGPAKNTLDIPQQSAFLARHQ